MKRVVLFSYPVFLLIVTIFSFFFVDTHFFYLQWVFEHLQLQRNLKIFLLLIVIIIFFSYYVYFLHLLQLRKLTKREGIFLIIITALCLLPAYPTVFSYDIFNYMATAKVAYFYKENPYIVMPIEFTGDPILRFMHAPNKTALYGPVWILISAVPYLLSFGNFLVGMYLFKVLVMVFYLLVLYLLFKMSKNMFPVLFFGLNPLVVIETLLSGHNDIVMVWFLLLFLLCIFRSKYGPGITFLVFSIFIKYATLPVVAVFLFIRKSKFQSGKVWRTTVLRWSMYLMVIVFLLSFLREEIYPWYAIWFLPFVALIGSRKKRTLAVILSVSLLLRYFPYYIFLTPAGMTALVKSLITFIPVLTVLFYFAISHVWSKK
ncbi:MAG: hypothetical protein Q8Q49_05930 [bacterium]|nr:hypothetical protein [bacterium]